MGWERLPGCKTEGVMEVPGVSAWALPALFSTLVRKAAILTRSFNDHGLLSLSSG